jgi:hypothetical protein
MIIKGRNILVLVILQPHIPAHFLLWRTYSLCGAVRGSHHAEELELHGAASGHRDEGADKGAAP